jgi:ribosomal protein S6
VKSYTKRYGQKQCLQKIRFLQHEEIFRFACRKEVRNLVKYGICYLKQDLKVSDIKWRYTVRSLSYTIADIKDTIYIQFFYSTHPAAVKLFERYMLMYPGCLRTLTTKITLKELNNIERAQFSTLELAVL